MMLIDYETPSYALYYDSLYGVGYVRRKADGAKTALITGTDMVELRRTLNRTKTNATSKRKAHRPFEEIANVILSEHFPLECSGMRTTMTRWTFDGLGVVIEHPSKRIICRDVATLEDAKLIVAAPRLVEALDAARDRLELCNFDGEETRYLEQISRALALAGR